MIDAKPRDNARPLVAAPSVRAPQRAEPQTTVVRVAVRQLDAFYGATRSVQDVSIDFLEGQVTAIIGPSGCGKSTLLRCLNRMHEAIPGARTEGEVLLDSTDIYAKGVNPTQVRRRIGMVFQRPTPFPTMSIRDNVAAGFRGLGSQGPDKRDIDGIVEASLRRAALWDEVKDRLKKSAVALSGGQQQRLCIARALATGPSVILLDEPTASLDPLSTQKVEELVHDLRGTVTVIIVTHNMQQAARVSDRTAFMLNGQLIEVSPTSKLFTTPADERTEAYITGRFG
jgi:phosphate transport system ATP-binding protein